MQVIRGDEVAKYGWRGADSWRSGEYLKYAAFIREAERRCGIPRDLLARLCAYDPDAITGRDRSALGCLGIAQLPLSAERVYGVNRLDPLASVIAGARYLRDLRVLFGSWHRAILAFRWDPECVKKLVHCDPGEISPEVPRLIAEDVAKIYADVRVPA